MKLRDYQHSSLWVCACFLLALAGSVALSACSSDALTNGNSGSPDSSQPPPGQTDNENSGQSNSNENGDPPGDGNSLDIVWSHAFEASEVGALSAVWGSAPDDVFVVGGTPGQGEVYHFDGDRWSAMNVPAVPLLVWVFGFGPKDVTAVGVEGGVIHYDGQSWAKLDSGTTEDLWGIWGSEPDDLWIVGGDVGEGDPVLLHFDGSTFTLVASPDNDREATSLFKVWGIGSKVFAVGENGLIIQYTDGQWLQVPAGAAADDDFVSLWGTSEDNIVAVGGRSGARIAVYDGTAWTTFKPSGVPGLNAVAMSDPGEAVLGGIEGWVGTYNPLTDTLTPEDVETSLTVHGAWADGAGRTYAVGGRFSSPFVGLALVRTIGDPGIDPVPPLAPAPDCVVDADCSLDEVCLAGACLPSAVCEGDVDTDGDGVCDLADPCPSDNPDDTDGDGVCDSDDPCPEDAPDDTDGDGICDSADLCPLDHPDDTDGDGVCDSDDLCGGDDATGDSDGDGVCDDQDLCSGDNTSGDTDEDGVCDGDDPCPLDNPDDTDGDGVCDADDLCPGADDSIDSDGDGIPNGCDTCEGSPSDLDGDGEVGPFDLAMLLGTWGPCPKEGDCPADFNDDAQVGPFDLAQLLASWGPVDSGADSDDDGVADACDVCPGHDDSADADADGVPDGCDVCPGGDDHSDSDFDGTPDACDLCPNDNPDDTDGDGVCDSDDPCPNDNPDDTDGDGVCDSDDPCPQDNPDDSDGDGVCDSDDICPGFDDNVDKDGNGIPDGCCESETDCALGTNCDDGVCVPANGADVEVGVGGDPFDNCMDDSYTRLTNGDDLPLCEGPQGFVEMWLSFRASGFAPPADVSVTRSLRLLNSNCDTDQDCGFGEACLAGLCSAIGERTSEVQLTDIGGGIGEFVGLLDIIFDSANELDGEEVLLYLEVEELDNPSLNAALEVNLSIFVRRLCFGDTCPPGQECIDFYCHPE